jgi:hypothetical protein
MMAHDHGHRCVCEHERVRYCRSCRTVYCEDCKQEWVTRPTYWPYVTYQQTLPSPIYSAANVSQKSVDLTSVITSCSHTNTTA